jgi:selenocysteine lyase/cysteine desulfurase
VFPDLRTTIRVETGEDLELAERNIATTAGLRVAVDEHLATPAFPRRQRLLARIEDQVAGWPSARRLGDGSARAGICSVIFDGPEIEKIYRRLAERGVNTWIGHGDHTPLFACGAEFLRISVGDRSTDADVDVLLTELDAAIA